MDERVIKPSIRQTCRSANAFSLRKKALVVYDTAIMPTDRILILGAGPTGLGAAWELKKSQHPHFQVVEQSATAGGLATSYLDDKGFTWDIGGHVIHSHYKYFDDVIEQAFTPKLLTHTRSAWIWMMETMLPYPLQYNFTFLPKLTKEKCIEDLIELAQVPTTQTHNYLEWLEQSFGKYMTKIFHEPYAKKVWSYQPQKMNTKWIGERVAIEDVESLLKRTAAKTPLSTWGPNYKFVYPERGGNGALWNYVGKHLSAHISYGKTATEIDIKKNTVTFSDGDVQQYDKLISTLPLDILLNMTGLRVPKMSTSLVYAKVAIVGVGISGPPPAKLKNVQWMYFPEKQFPFFRVTLLHNFSTFMTPKGMWSLMCEVSFPKGKKFAVEDLNQQVIEAFRKEGFITQENTVESVWNTVIERGYPVPALPRDEFLNTAIPLLESYQIYSRGRFGAWKYEVSNQDHSFMQGVEVAERLLRGTAETTLKIDR